MKKRQGSVSLYIIVVMTIVTLIATLFLRSFVLNISSQTKGIRKLESEMISEHGITMVKNELYRRILAKEEGVIDIPPQTIYKDTKDIIDKGVKVLGVDVEIFGDELGEKESIYRLVQREGFENTLGLFSKHHQIEVEFKEMLANNGETYTTNTSTLGRTGIAKITGVYNETTLVPDYYIVSLTKDGTSISIHSYNIITSDGSLEFIGEYDIKSMLKKYDNTLDIEKISWDEDIVTQAVYDKSLEVLVLYIGIKIDNAVYIYMYEPYSLDNSDLTFIAKHEEDNEIEQISIKGVYSEAMGTVELVVTTQFENTIKTSLFIPLLPDLGFDEVINITLSSDKIRAMDTGYVWDCSKGTNTLIYAVIIEKDRANKVLFLEGYPHINSSVEQIMEIEEEREGDSLYTIAIGLLKDDDVGGTTLIAAVGDYENNEIVTRSGLIELRSWEEGTRKAIKLGDTEGVGRLSMAMVGGDFSQTILMNSEPILEEVVYDVENVYIEGKTYDRNGQVQSKSKLKPKIELRYEEPELGGQREIIKYMVTKIDKDFEVVR